MYTLPASLYEKISENLLYLKYIGFNFSDYYIDLNEVYILMYLIPAVLLIWILPNTQQIFSDFDPVYDYYVRKRQFLTSYYSDRIIDMIQWKPTLRWSFFISLLFVLSFLSLSRVTEFLYFQF
jgi:alginate O-acetyltransferase complex protein AlgI